MSLLWSQCTHILMLTTNGPSLTYHWVAIIKKSLRVPQSTSLHTHTHTKWSHDPHENCYIHHIVVMGNTPIMLKQQQQWWQKQILLMPNCCKVPKCAKEIWQEYGFCCLIGLWQANTFSTHTNKQIHIHTNTLANERPVRQNKRRMTRATVKAINPRPDCFGHPNHPHSLWLRCVCVCDCVLVWVCNCDVFAS